MVRKEYLLRRTIRKLSTEFGILIDQKSEHLSLLESTSLDLDQVLKSSILEEPQEQLVLMSQISLERLEFFMQSSFQPDVEEI